MGCCHTRAWCAVLRGGLQSCQGYTLLFALCLAGAVLVTRGCCERSTDEVDRARREWTTITRAAAAQGIRILRMDFLTVHSVPYTKIRTPRTRTSTVRSSRTRQGHQVGMARIEQAGQQQGRVGGNRQEGINRLQCRAAGNASSSIAGCLSLPPELLRLMMMSM